MRNLNRMIIAAGTAALVFLGLAGTRAQADNVAPRAKAKSALEQIRQQVEERNASDGGCG